MPFRKASDCITRSITANIMGKRGGGKSHFAIDQSPRPLVIQALDPTFKTILDKFNLDKVHIADYDRISPELVKAVAGVKSKEDISKAGNAFDKMQAEATKVWKQYTDDFQEALKIAKTIVWDTGSESWELLRLARFGKLMEIPPQMYGGVNSEYREMIRAAQYAGINLIILSKMKEKWGETVSASGRINRGPTGEWEPQGFSHIGYEVTFEGEVFQSSCTCKGKGKPHPGECLAGVCECTSPCGADNLFHLKVLKCTQNPSLLYEDIPEPTFPLIASLIYPDSDESDWR